MLKWTNNVGSALVYTTLDILATKKNVDFITRI